MNEQAEKTVHGTRLTSIQDLKDYAGEIHKRLTRFAVVTFDVQRDDAEDLAQEAYARAWAHREDYDDTGNLMSWLIRIMKNLYFDRQRSTSVRDIKQDRAIGVIENELQGNLHHQAPDILAERIRRDDIARKAVRGLPGLQGEAFEMYINGLEQPEIGAILGKSVDAVESLLARAKRALKENTELQALREENSN